MPNSEFKYHVIETYSFAGNNIEGFLEAKKLHTIVPIFVTGVWVHFWDSLTPNTGKVLINDWYLNYETYSLTFDCILENGLSWLFEGGAQTSGNLIITYLPR